VTRVDHVGEIRLPNGSCLQLTDYYASSDCVSNLRCISNDGSTSWSAELLDPKLGHYVAVEVIGDRIFAQSFDCFRVELDPSNGRAIASEFTK
jgi:hypothetical protein